MVCPNGSDFIQKQICNMMRRMINMDWEKVEWYAGYRGEEKPRAVVEGGQRIEVVEILWQKRIKDRKSGEESQVFRCRLADGRLVTIVKPD